MLSYRKCPNCGEPEHPDMCVIPAIPGGPRYVTEVDGCMVHGDAPMSDKSKDEMRQVIAAVKDKLKRDADEKL